MAEYIEREAVERKLADIYMELGGYKTRDAFYKAIDIVHRYPAADVAPVRHGRWILEANKERTNYRWNVTAECSECCDEKKEIWGGFFPNVPDCIARDAALVSAESVKLSNFCPNCGAKMDGVDDG